MSRKSLSPAERGLHTRRSQGEPKACLKLSFSAGSMVSPVSFCGKDSCKGFWVSCVSESCDV